MTYDQAPAASPRERSPAAPDTSQGAVFQTSNSAALASTPLPPAPAGDPDLLAQQLAFDAQDYRLNRYTPCTGLGCFDAAYDPVVGEMDVTLRLAFDLAPAEGSDLWDPHQEAWRVPVCAVDERLDLDRATAVTVAEMKATWDDEQTRTDNKPLLATLQRHTELQPGVVLALHALKRCYELSQDLYLHNPDPDLEDSPPICAGTGAPKAEVIRTWPEDP